MKLATHSFAPALNVATKAPDKSMGLISVTDILDIRVPTTTPEFPEASKKAILDSIQPGDIILETNNAYPHWQRMEMVTLHSVFSHAAIFEEKKDGKYFFLEATTGEGAGVIRTDLSEYMTGPIKMAVIRPDYKTPEDRDAALDYCRKQLGKPYDSRFDFSDDSSYACTELVSKALKNMPNPIAVGEHKVLGRSAVGPDDFLKIPNAKIIYKDNCTLVKNLATHWPVVAGGLVAAAAAGIPAGLAFGGWAAAGAGLAGMALGTTAATLVGNKMQTGYFNMWGCEV